MVLGQDVVHRLVRHAAATGSREGVERAGRADFDAIASRMAASTAALSLGEARVTWK